MAGASRRQGSFACPRGKNTLREVTRSRPSRRRMGSIAYECPACSYLTSVIWPAKRQTGAFGFLSQSFGERLTAIAMVMMVIGYLVWPLVQ